MTRPKWHLRQASIEDYNRANHLFDLHGLTLSWLIETKNPVSIPARYEALSLLPTDEKTLFNFNFENMLFAQYPEEYLDRLQSEATAFQSQTLEALLRQQETLSIAEISKRYGSENVARRWTGLPSYFKEDLIGLLNVARQSATFALSSQHSHLIIRSVTRELIIEWGIENRDLAVQHAYWLFGLLLALNPKIEMLEQPSATNRLRIQFSLDDPSLR